MSDPVPAPETTAAPAPTPSLNPPTDAPAAGSEAADDPLEGASLVNSDTPSPDKGDDANGGADGGEGGDKGDEAAPSPFVGAAPEAYEITAPEGTTLDAKALEMFDPIFRDLTLTNEGAQKLVDAAPAFIEHIGAAKDAALLANVVESRKAWAKAAMEDEEIGGPKFEESKAACAKLFDRVGFKQGEGFRSFLDESGLGNHPDLIRGLVRLAKMTGEDSFTRSASDGGDAGVPIWDRVYSGPSEATQ